MMHFSSAVIDAATDYLQALDADIELAVLSGDGFVDTVSLARQNITQMEDLCLEDGNRDVMAPYALISAATQKIKHRRRQTAKSRDQEIRSQRRTKQALRNAAFNL